MGQRKGASDEVAKLAAAVMDDREDLEEEAPMIVELTSSQMKKVISLVSLVGCQCHQ